MTRLLVQLKLRLLRNAFRRSPGQLAGLVIGMAFAAVFTGLAVTLLTLLRFTGPGSAEATVVIGGSLLTLGWAVVPMLFAGVDETLDPARFALLPLRGRDLAPGLLLAGVLGTPGIATSVLGLATLVTWSRGPLPLLIALPAAVTGVLTCVLTSRLVTTAAARLLTTRRARDSGTVIFVLLLSTAGLWPTLIVRQLSPPEPGAPGSARTTVTAFVHTVEQIAAVLGWTPLGLPWAAPADAATGHGTRGLIRLVLAVVVLVLGLAVWARLLDRALTRHTAGGGTRARAGRAFANRLPGTPAGAVAARCLRYWRRDPRYLIAGAGVLVAGVIPLIAISVSPGQHGVLLVAGPFCGALLGVITANDVGYDGSAFATHLLTGLPGWADRLGRVLAVSLWAVPAVAVIATAGAVLSGYPGLIPGAIGAALGGLLPGLGTASIASAAAPYPVPEAGGNPFRASSGGSARGFVSQIAVMTATGGAATPGVILLVVAAVWWPPASWIGLITGPAIGLGILIAGVVLGGRIVDSRGPEIFAAIRRPPV